MYPSYEYVILYRLPALNKFIIHLDSTFRKRKSNIFKWYRMAPGTRRFQWRAKFRSLQRQRNGTLKNAFPLSDTSPRVVSKRKRLNIGSTRLQYHLLPSIEKSSGSVFHSCVPDNFVIHFVVNTTSRYSVLFLSLKPDFDQPRLILNFLVFSAEWW